MGQNKGKSKLLTVAEIKLVYKNKAKTSKRPRITSSKKAYKLFIKNWDMNKIELHEQFKVLLLNRAMKALGIIEISSGGINSTIVDIRHILVAALKANAVCLMLAHNHPSGSTKPSRPDEQITQELKNAADLLDIKLMDHLIITKESYLSFADQGLL
jgi:DNA repair protein RadC